MLKLERMQVAGFKSFSDRTDIRFPSGVTAVVGPNGCGKSNIGDALNWVLGEQSAKMLRGKQMADIIFNGSEARKPLGLAEVSLHFGQAEGLEGSDGGKIVVTRRLFRSGESDYMLNGKRVRLKDIQEVLARGHVGARTYATIEQGRIDQILNAKPKDRRLIIEDAAGIASYKNKRRLAELKLEATHANLLRVNDIVVEVERQIRSLKRQAGKARRYRSLREELRGKEQVRFALRTVALDAGLSEARTLEAAARDAEAEIAARASRLEVELDTERDGIETAAQELRTHAERMHALDIEIDRDETTIRASRERADESRATAGRNRDEAAALTGRRESIAEEIESRRRAVDEGRGELERLDATLLERQQALEAARRDVQELREALEALRRDQFGAMNDAAEARNRLRTTEETIETVGRERARLDAERTAAGADWARLEDEVAALVAAADEQRCAVESLRAACTTDEQELVEARATQAEQVEALAAVREQEKSAAARLHTLEDVATRFAGVSDGVRAVLTADSAAGLRSHGVVADFIEAPTDVERAAESYLAAFLPTVILEDDDDVHRAANLLRREGAGRTSLISRTHPVGGLAVGAAQNGAGPPPAELMGQPGVHGKLRERITLRTSANGMLADRVGDAVLVDGLETALAMHRRYPAYDYITSDGEVVYASGVVAAGGTGDGDRGLLAHKRRMNEARAEFGTASTGAAGLQVVVERCRERVVTLEVRLRERRQELEVAQQRRIELEMQSTRSTDDHERTGRRRAILADELASALDRHEQLRVTLQELVAQVEAAESRHGGLERDLTSRREVLEERERAAATLGEELGGVRAELAAARQRQSGVEADAARLAESAAELDQRVASLRAAGDGDETRAAEADAAREAAEAALLARLDERKRLGSTVSEQEQALAERRRALTERETGLRGLRAESESVRTATRDAELRRTRLESEREHLDDLCRQELGCSAGEAAAAAAETAREAGTVLGDVDLEALERDVVEIRDKIERIGPVNMTAIDEFSDLEERHGFLTAQRKDLEDSMNSLRETIKRLNRQSRDRFLEAFEAIRGHYREIFTLLFNGGRADLRLEEGEDVLEAGVEIMVQPPGKRLGNVQLMSGGEKALSAIALLFAVFRFQPSPFCLLDEVDAALDDSNVGRFTRMVREYAKQTQFILVTHNKLSMEAADLIYGVTMQEPGVSKLVSLQLT